MKAREEGNDVFSEMVTQLILVWGWG